MKILSILTLCISVFTSQIGATQGVFCKRTKIKDLGVPQCIQNQKNISEIFIEVDIRKQATGMWIHTGSVQIGDCVFTPFPKFQVKYHDSTAKNSRGALELIGRHSSEVNLEIPYDLYNNRPKIEEDFLPTMDSNQKEFSGVVRFPLETDYEFVPRGREQNRKFCYFDSEKILEEHIDYIGIAIRQIDESANYFIFNANKEDTRISF